MKARSESNLIAISNLEGNLTYVNPAFPRCLGLPGRGGGAEPRGRRVLADGGEGRPGDQRALDISAVEILDSFFARTAAETAQMVGLMGGETVIAGMRPNVAITATQLGLTLGKAKTALDIERALDLLGGL